MFTLLYQWNLRSDVLWCVTSLWSALDMHSTKMSVEYISQLVRRRTLNRQFSWRNTVQSIMVLVLYNYLLCNNINITFAICHNCWHITWSGAVFSNSLISLYNLCVCLVNMMIAWLIVLHPRTFHYLITIHKIMINDKKLLPVCALSIFSRFPKWSWFDSDPIIIPPGWIMHCWMLKCCTDIYSTGDKSLDWNTLQLRVHRLWCRSQNQFKSK